MINKNELNCIYTYKNGTDSNVTISEIPTIHNVSIYKIPSDFEFSDDTNCKCCTSVRTDYIEDIEDTGMTDPFDIFVKKMRAFLGADPDVTVLSDANAKVINIAVAGCSKPEAYRRFFPGTRNIKGIGEVKILVNGHDKTYVTHCDIETLKTMLANHPLVKEIKVSYNSNKTINRIFVIFKNQTVQFKSDDWASPWCVTTTIAEDLAKLVMKGSGMVILWVTDSEFSLAEHSPEHP